MKKSVKNCDPTTFGKVFIWELLAFGNSSLTALAAVKILQPTGIELQNISGLQETGIISMLFHKNIFLNSFLKYPRTKVIKHLNNLKAILQTVLI
jgi:hypothetical protein